MRTLYYVPTVHTCYESQESAELPGLETQEGLSQVHEAVHIGVCWNRARAALDKALKGTRRPLMMFADGLPYPKGKLARPAVVSALATPTTWTFRYYSAKGAQLNGTENPRMLRKHNRYLREVHNNKRCADRRFERELIRERDRAIARRIAATLRNGQTGVLFMGGCHRVWRYLKRIAPDIRIRFVRSFDDLIPLREQAWNR